MRLLELFSGTGSVGNVFKEHGWDVVSLDRDLPADISTDIMDWDYMNSPYPPKHFDVIWASPPCTEYSIAKTRGVRNLQLANNIVQRTLEILNYFDPIIFFVENPQTGLLKHQPFMRHLSYNDVDYCKHGMPYRKRTRLWNNCQSFESNLCNRDCDTMDEQKRRHKEVAQQGVSKHSTITHHVRELYVIPPDLVFEILRAVNRGLAADALMNLIIS